VPVVRDQQHSTLLAVMGLTAFSQASRRPVAAAAETLTLSVVLAVLVVAVVAVTQLRQVAQRRRRVKVTLAVTAALAEGLFHLVAAAAPMPLAATRHPQTLAATEVRVLRRQ
jgi:hypothetical protein